MAKRKLERFEEMKSMGWVIQPTMETIRANSFHLKGKWGKEFFKNEHPIIIELGCGKGEYAVGLGMKYPNKNFVGVDIKGARIWRGAKDVEENDLKNIGFLRHKVDFIDRFFDKEEVSEIWLTFSDPQKEKPNKRLTSFYFIERYRNFLKTGGIIHLKTDSDLLFESTLNEVKVHNYEMLEHTWDVYGTHFENLDLDTQEIMKIKTHYEKIFSGKGSKIKYCKFKIDR